MEQGDGCGGGFGTATGAGSNAVCLDLLRLLPLLGSQQQTIASNSDLVASLDQAIREQERKLQQMRQEYERRTAQADQGNTQVKQEPIEERAVAPPALVLSPTIITSPPNRRSARKEGARGSAHTLLSRSRVRALEDEDYEEEEEDQDPEDGEDGDEDFLPSPVLSSTRSPTLLPSPSSGSALSELPRVKRGQGVSCHSCKTNKERSALFWCTSTGTGVGASKRRCRKKYCPSCLRRAYAARYPASEAEVKCWVCPSCRCECLCANCVRRDRAAEERFERTGAGTAPSPAAAAVTPKQAKRLVAKDSTSISSPPATRRSVTSVSEGFTSASGESTPLGNDDDVFGSGSRRASEQRGAASFRSPSSIAATISPTIAGQKRKLSTPGTPYDLQNLALSTPKGTAAKQGAGMTFSLLPPAALSGSADNPGAGGDLHLAQWHYSLQQSQTRAQMLPLRMAATGSAAPATHSRQVSAASMGSSVSEHEEKIRALQAQQEELSRLEQQILRKRAELFQEQRRSEQMAGEAMAAAACSDDGSLLTPLRKQARTASLYAVSPHITASQSTPSQGRSLVQHQQQQLNSSMPLPDPQQPVLRVPGRRFSESMLNEAFHSSADRFVPMALVEEHPTLAAPAARSGAGAAVFMPPAPSVGSRCWSEPGSQQDELMHFSRNVSGVPSVFAQPTLQRTAALSVEVTSPTPARDLSSAFLMASPLGLFASPIDGSLSSSSSSMSALHPMPSPPSDHAVHFSSFSFNSQLPLLQAFRGSSAAAAMPAMSLLPMLSPFTPLSPLPPLLPEASPLGPQSGGFHRATSAPDPASRHMEFPQ